MAWMSLRQQSVVGDQVSRTGSPGEMTIARIVMTIASVEVQPVSSRVSALSLRRAC